MENIRLDEIFEFWASFGKSNKDILEDKKSNDIQNIDPYDEEDVSSLTCSVCKKNIPYRAGIKRPYHGMENCLKEIKKIFSQLQVYGINSSFKCVCHQCSSQKDNAVKVILKDHLNNKYIIEGSLDGLWDWEREVDFIIELIRFYKAFSSRAKNMIGQLYKSKKSKDRDSFGDDTILDPLVAISRARIEIEKNVTRLQDGITISRNVSHSDKQEIINIEPLKFG